MSGEECQNGTKEKTLESPGSAMDTIGGGGSRQDSRKWIKEGDGVG